MKSLSNLGCYPCKRSSITGLGNNNLNGKFFFQLFRETRQLGRRNGRSNRHIFWKTSKVIVTRECNCLIRQLYQWNKECRLPNQVTISTTQSNKKIGTIILEKIYI